MKHLTHTLFFIALALTASVGHLSAATKDDTSTRIQSSAKRAEVLALADKYATYPETIRERTFDTVKIPFTDAVLEDNILVSDEWIENLTPRDILIRVIKEYRPQGIIMRNKSFYLMYEDIGPIKEGNYFKAEMYGQKYPIRVQTITDKAYVLRYQNVSARVLYTVAEDNTIEQSLE